MRRPAFIGVAAAGIGGTGAVLVASGALAASGTSPSPPACQASNFAARMKVIPNSAGAGQISYRLKLTNNGSSACRMGNHPGLKMKKANGAGMPTHVFPTGPSAVITVAKGGTAKAALRFSPDVPPCEGTAHKVKVSLATPGTGSVVGPVKPPTRFCGAGSIDEKPLH